MINFKINSPLTKDRIKPYVRETYLDYSIPLSKTLNADIYLKCENLQFTSAFKVRGAFNKLLLLSDAQKKQGVVAASSGNHGAAIAFGLTQLKIPGMIFVPENASTTKIANIRNYDIPLKLYATEMLQTEIQAIEYAKHHNMIYVSPYNDPDVILGQSTIGFEIIKQLPKVEVVLVPVGGGGLISGIAGYIKSVSPQTQMIGCLPENSPVMAECIKAGHLIEMKTLPTLSDATAGNIEHGSITFELCKKYVDDFILVTEDEIKEAIQTIINRQHLLIEGAAGVAIAALLKSYKRFREKNVVVVLSGGNIGIDVLKQIFC